MKNAWFKRKGETEGYEGGRDAGLRRGKVAGSFLVAAGVVAFGAAILWQTGLLAVADEAWEFQAVLERFPALEAAEGTRAVVQEEKEGAKKIQNTAQEDASLQGANGALPYSLYLGSASAQFPERARDGMAQLRRKGIDPYWVEVELSKGVWYRIYTGSFSSREEAESFKKEKGLKKAEIKEVPYANLIGVYGSPKGAQWQIEALREKELWPYVAEAPPGTYRVFVGAFHGEERARRQQAQLTAEGIESDVVRR